MPNKVNDIAGNRKSVCFHICEAHIEHRRGDQFSLSNLRSVHQQQHHRATASLLAKDYQTVYPVSGNLSNKS